LTPDQDGPNGQPAQTHNATRHKTEESNAFERVAFALFEVPNVLSRNWAKASTTELEELVDSLKKNRRWPE
jgi:hypothetical protein